MLLAAVSVTIGIGIAVLLTLMGRARLPDPYRPYAAMGIALGGAAGAWINLLLLWTMLGRRIGSLFDRAAAKATLRLAAGAMAAAIAASAARGWLEPQWSGGGFFSVLALLLAVGASGAVPYLLIARRPPVILQEEGQKGAR